MTESRAALILAGGAGTRLWPLSTEDRPKQFLELFEGRSLLQHTWARISRSFPRDRIFVSTRASYEPAILDQLSDLTADQLILEPSRRNTGPAIATSTAWIEKRLGDTTVAVFPADHFVADENVFLELVERAVAFASRGERLVTIAIRPTSPETGYGYLELGEPAGDGVVDVVRFVEKPDVDRARQFVESGRFAWNGGMFVWRASTMRAELRGVDAPFAHLVNEWAEAPDQSVRDAIYETMPALSIDYALMEKSSHVVAVPGDFGWSDVGSWKAVAGIVGARQPPNAVVEAASRVFVHSTVSRPVLVIGVDGVAVIDTPDGLLVIDLEKTEELREAVARLRR